ncbi:MAG: glycoside hydrolase [Planctomycetia bacterium]|nr:glycoside hydrolase [Planctomycetia bacterium]
MRHVLLWMSCLVLMVGSSAAEEVSFRSAWARSGDVTLNQAENGFQVLEYSGDQDFCTNASRRIPVEAGDIVEIACLARAEGKGDAHLSVILYKGSQALSWSYGSSELLDEKEKRVVSRMIIPPGADAIVPRVMGGGSKTVFFRDYTVKQVEKIPFVTEAKEIVRENAFLKVTFHAHTATMDVLDKRTGRVWKQPSKSIGFWVMEAEPLEKGIRWKCLTERMFTFEATAILEADLPELVVTIDAAKEEKMRGNIRFPESFLGEERDRVILPLNEGFSYPVTGERIGPHSTHTYGGHGLCMGFWGIAEESVSPEGEVLGEGALLAIFETPDDSGLTVEPHPENGRLAVRPWWCSQCQKWGYARTLRYVFLEKGGHVAIAKRYREYAKKIGLYVPFTEKIRRNPALKDGIDRLIGAANIWCWEKDRDAIYAEMQSLGMTRLLASSGGSPEEIRKWNENPTMLTCRYDIYQDIMNPEMYDEIGFRHWPHMGKAWPNDLNMTETGDWRRGWEVSHKDKTKPRIPCGVLCDSRALPYAEEYISNELKEKPYKARFLDTTVASAWRECYHPDHPMTRSDSKFWKMKLLELIGKRFNMVCGSETGHEASVPYCDFYEGMMSLGPFRVPDSGRKMIEIWDDPPERVEKYQVGEAYRLPLWELVYHDCTVSYWYWGDYNNKLPSLWKKRDLFNALYGVPPMYMFTKASWNANKERFVESYRMAQPVSRMTGYDEMTNHRILTADRSVQQTSFANGVRVTANFGEKDYTMPDGFVVKAKEVRVEKLNGN